MADFAATKQLFSLPKGVVYLDGNSLGPLPKAAMARLSTTVEEEWGRELIRAWNSAGWMARPRSIGDRIARLIGAASGSVVMGDTLSIKVFQALAAGLALRPGRTVILSDTGNFPSDLYMAQGLCRLLGNRVTLKVVEPEAVLGAIDDQVAVVMLTHVDYRTGAMHDMAAITAKAHAHGAVMVWDLAHSAGAVEVDLSACRAEFAVGCTYKYLNGGPGAPAFIYVRPDIADYVEPPLSGWLGHATPFAFELAYAPGRGIERMRVGTPPILALAALEAALDIFDHVQMREVRAQSLRLTDLFIKEAMTAVPELELVTPIDANRRGSQVSFRHPQGYAAMRALIDVGVIGDFRAPDIMRFGVTPLFIDEADVRTAAGAVGLVMRERRWDNIKYRERLAVT
jgi:kynureninase